MDNPFILYGRPGPGSLAVQIALEEMGLSYERVSESAVKKLEADHAKHA